MSENKEFKNQDERTQMLLELIKHPLKPDDTFKFHCTQCGNCCKYRNDILLNPFDLCRMSKALGISLPDVLQKYTYFYVGETSKFPLVALKMQENTGFCPFLNKDNSCRIQEGKPSVCALYPLGRFTKKKTDSKSEGGLKVQYFLQPVFCGTRDEAHTLGEWLKGFGMEESEEWLSVWHEAVNLVSDKTRSIFPELSERLEKEITAHLVSALYFQYDTAKPMVPQVKANASTAVKMLDDIQMILASGI